MADGENTSGGGARRKSQRRTVVLPSGTLEQARQQLGYMEEQMGTLLAISYQTWRRWRVKDEVPTVALPALAHVLGMPELQQQFEQLTTGREIAAQLPRLRAEAEALNARIERNLQTLRDLGDEMGDHG